MAVDLDGSVWVANKEHEEGFAGSVVKIGIVVGGTEQTELCNPERGVTLGPPFTYNTCMDRNGDGLITTSSGLKPLDWPGEVDQFGGVTEAVDECIIGFWRLEGERIHHVAVDRSNNIWTGGHNPQHSTYEQNNTFELIDSATGEVITEKSFDVACGDFHGVVDANDVLWSASNTPLWGRGFRYETTEDLATCCSASLLTDSDNDGVITAADEAIEEASPGLEVYINDDDDNNNLIPDIDETAVTDEDDLLEIQLHTTCFPVDPSTAWWSVSWTGADPAAIRLWETSQKSGGPHAGIDMPLTNGDPYTWPPPATLWIEATDVFSDMDILFTVNTDPAASDKTDLVRARGNPLKLIHLRKVVIVEPGADPDMPTWISGGCKLTTAEIDQHVTELFAQNHILGKGFVLFDIDGLHKLESGCMIVTPFPGQPYWSLCLLNDPGNPDNNIRVVPIEFYKDHIINQPPGGFGQLTGDVNGDGSDDGDKNDDGCQAGTGNFCDGYATDPCTLNLYFTGGLNNLPPGYSTLGEWLPEPTAVVITDATGSNSYIAPFLTSVHKLTLIHELHCHMLPEASGHYYPSDLWLCTSADGVVDPIPFGEYPCTELAICLVIDICAPGDLTSPCSDLGYYLPNVSEYYQTSTTNVRDFVCEDPP